MAGPKSDPIADDLAGWLDAHADRLDADSELAVEVVPRLAAARLFRAGVPEALGGSGGATPDAIEAIAAVAAHSLTAAFVFWGQRTFIEYLLQSPNAALRERWLGPLLAGEFAGATGLSNAMKFLSGIESLQIDATRSDTGWQLDGGLAWITNLRKEGFIAAAAVNMPDGAPPAVAAFIGSAVDNDDGVVRSADLDLIALRGSNTAAVRLHGVRIGAESCCTKMRAPGCRACVPPSSACSAACRSAWRAPRWPRRTRCRPACAARCWGASTPCRPSWRTRWTS